MEKCPICGFEESEEFPCGFEGCNEPAIYEGWFRSRDPFLNTPTGLVKRMVVCENHKIYLIGQEKE